MMKLIVLAAFLATASATSLTPDNWDEATAGKTVFIKFQAPWWGHCKSMKPAWDKLMGEFEGHASALVGDVDCTAAGKPLCDSNGVQGFPTIKHGSPGALEDYKGGRTFDDLKKFAEENLKPSCSPSNIDLCDDDKKAEIEKLQAMDATELKTAIEAKETEQKDAEAAFDKAVKKLQKKYEKLQKKKDKALADVKDSGLSLMKQVSAHAAKATKEDTKEEL